MKTAVFSPTLQAKYRNPLLWSKIEQLDLTLIHDRMILKHGWTEERTEKAIADYRKYLYLTQMVEQMLSPAGDIDEIWHEHILHTNKYALDCEKVFGKFLHHFPTPAKWKQQQKEAMALGKAGGFCCNHQDCCNDNPPADRKPGLKATVSGMIVENCAPIGGSDSKCSGTTNCGNGADNRRFNFDNPDMESVPASILFKDVVHTYFQ